VVDAVVTLAVVITLAVGAAAQPGLGEQLVLDLALLLELDLAFEDEDFAREIDRPARRSFQLANVDGTDWLGWKCHVRCPNATSNGRAAGNKSRAKGAQHLELDFLGQ
jgi:hypothetical protein